MNRGNKLWEGHRMMLPELAVRATHTCGDCRFFIKIVGREEIKPGCVAGVKEYRDWQKRVPRILSLVKLLQVVGREELMAILEVNDPGRQACYSFRYRYDK
jgi:hypothetical protein